MRASPELRALLVEQHAWEAGSAEMGGNAGFLFLKKHKIHLNSNVLPSVLNHLENISLTGTTVISTMLDFIPFWLHFHCFLLAFTVGVAFWFFFFVFFLLKFVMCSELQRILWKQEILNSTKEIAPKTHPCEKSK